MVSDANQALLNRRFAAIGHSSPLFYQEPLHLVRGEGVWLYDADGKQYLDVYNNVPCVGHCHPHVVNAIAQQASTLNIHTRYLHENIVNYVERLTSKFDAPLTMAMLACTGSEANEIALRMARHHTGKQGIIVTDFAYHGNTEAVAELGTSFMPDARTTRRVQAFAVPDTYVGLEGVASEDLCSAYLDSVKAAMARLEADGMGVAGILFCPIFANEGLVNLPAGFLEQAVALVRDAGGLYIADEVQGGFGRTGHHWWAYQESGVVPDIVTLGKPMGNGHPISGVIAKPALIEAFTEWGMYFNTFGGNPVSCAAAMAVIDVIEQEQLMENAVNTGAYVTEGLRALQSEFEVMGDVRSNGLFFAVEMVTDRLTKSPATHATTQLINRMRNRGVLISRIGRHENVLKMRPPLCFSKVHADQLLETLRDCLREQ